MTQDEVLNAQGTGKIIPHFKVTKLDGRRRHMPPKLWRNPVSKNEKKRKKSPNNN